MLLLIAWMLLFVGVCTWGHRAHWSSCPVCASWCKENLPARLLLGCWSARVDKEGNKKTEQTIECAALGVVTVETAPSHRAIPETLFLPLSCRNSCDWNQIKHSPKFLTGPCLCSSTFWVWSFSPQSERKASASIGKFSFPKKGISKTSLLIVVCVIRHDSFREHKDFWLKSDCHSFEILNFVLFQWQDPPLRRVGLNQA